MKKYVKKGILALIMSIIGTAAIGTVNVNAASKDGLVLENGAFHLYVDGVRDTTRTGLFLYDGEWFMLNNGTVDTSLVGMVEYDNALFYVAEGRMLQEYSGLALDGTDWYYVGAGKVQEVTQLVSYDNEWFVVTDGKLDTSINGAYEYDGAKFFVAAGMLDDSVSGLQVCGDAWYYFANGQVADYTGLVLYDGAWFYVTDGMLAVDYTGWVSYDGSAFYVVSGMVQAGSDTSGEVNQKPSEEQNKPQEEDITQQKPADLIGTVINQIIRADMTEFEKVKAIHDYMIMEIDYDSANSSAGTIPETSYTVEGVLTTRYAVYSGYALTFQALCERAGIACVYVSGSGYKWNQVCIDGQWYHIDTGRDDTTWKDKAFENHKYNTYNYFLLSDEDMYKDRTPDNAQYVCTAPSIAGKAFNYGCPWLDTLGYEYIVYIETQEDVKKAVEYVISNNINQFQIVVDENKISREEVWEMVEKSLIELGYNHTSLLENAGSGGNRCMIWNYQVNKEKGIQKQALLSSEEEIKKYIKELSLQKENIDKNIQVYLTKNIFDMEAINKEMLLSGIHSEYVPYDSQIAGYYIGWIKIRNTGYKIFTNVDDVVTACDKAHKNGEKEYLFLYDYRGTGMTQADAKERFRRDMNRDCLYYMETYMIYDDSHEGLLLVKYVFKNEEMENLVDAAVNQIIQADMTEIEKVKAIYDYMIMEIDYDYANFLADTVPETSYTVEGVLTTKYAICQGYALTFQALCERVGINCVYATGRTTSGEAHAWNQVCVDGQWYNVDTTWDDPVWEGKAFGDYTHNSYNYFLLSDEDMYKNHIPENIKYVCTAPSIAGKVVKYGCPWSEKLGYEYIVYIETQKEIKKAVEYVISNNIKQFQIVVDANKIPREEVKEMVQKSLIELGYNHTSLSENGGSSENRCMMWNYQVNKEKGIQKQALLSSEDEIKKYIKELSLQKENIDKYVQVYLTKNTFNMEAINKEMLLSGIRSEYVPHDSQIAGYYIGWIKIRNK